VGLVHTVCVPPCENEIVDFLIILGSVHCVLQAISYSYLVFHSNHMLFLAHLYSKFRLCLALKQIIYIYLGKCTQERFLFLLSHLTMRYLIGGALLGVFLEWWSSIARTLSIFGGGAPIVFFLAISSAIFI
jgi:hypothetical protein